MSLFWAGVFSILVCEMLIISIILMPVKCVREKSAQLVNFFVHVKHMRTVVITAVVLGFIMFADGVLTVVSVSRKDASSPEDYLRAQMSVKRAERNMHLSAMVLFNLFVVYRLVMIFRPKRAPAAEDENEKLAKVKEAEAALKGSPAKKAPEPQEPVSDEEKKNQ